MNIGIECPGIAALIRKGFLAQEAVLRLLSTPEISQVSDAHSL